MDIYNGNGLTLGELYDFLKDCIEIGEDLESPIKFAKDREDITTIVRNAETYNNSIIITENI